jgi:hypothetical protein
LIVVACSSSGWEDGRDRLGGTAVNERERPFDTIESAHEYVLILAERVEEVRRDIDAEITRAVEENADRRKDALQLICYNLTKLSAHMTSSGRILNDLRTLGRRLFAEESRAYRETES